LAVRRDGDAALNVHALVGAVEQIDALESFRTVVQSVHESVDVP
jgi:hypothetical protein